MNLLNAIRDLIGRYLAGDLAITALSLELVDYDQAVLDAALREGDEQPSQLQATAYCLVWEWSGGYRDEASVRKELTAALDALPNVVTYDEIIYPPCPHGVASATPTMHVRSSASSTLWVLQQEGA